MNKKQRLQQVLSTVFPDISEEEALLLWAEYESEFGEENIDNIDDDAIIMNLDIFGVFDSYRNRLLSLWKAKLADIIISVLSLEGIDLVEGYLPEITSNIGSINLGNNIKLIIHHGDRKT